MQRVRLLYSDPYLFSWKLRCGEEILRKRCLKKDRRCLSLGVFCVGS